MSSSISVKQTIDKLVKVKYLKALKKATKNDIQIGLDGLGRDLQQKLESELIKSATNGPRFQGVLVQDESSSFSVPDATKNVMFNVIFKTHVPCQGAKYDATANTFNFSLQPTLSIHTLCQRKEWKVQWQDLLRARRKQWKRFLVNPWSVRVEEKAVTSEMPKARLMCDFEDQDYQLSSGIELESIQALDDETNAAFLCHAKNVTDPSGYKIIKTETKLFNSTLALLMDADRKRIFIDSSRLGNAKQLLVFMSFFNPFVWQP